jgi:hypothetical protein
MKLRETEERPTEPTKSINQSRAITGLPPPLTQRHCTARQQPLARANRCRDMMDRSTLTRNPLDLARLPQTNETGRSQNQPQWAWATHRARPPIFVSSSSSAPGFRQAQGDEALVANTVRLPLASPRPWVNRRPMHAMHLISAWHARRARR